MRQATRSAFRAHGATLLAFGLIGCQHDFAFLQAPGSDLDAAGVDSSSAVDATTAEERDPSDGASRDGDARQDAEAPLEAGVLPDAAPVLTQFHRLAVGSGFACAIHPDDHVVGCFGDNQFYQLGTGAQSDGVPGSLSWTQVIDGPAGAADSVAFAHADSLSAGQLHACALRSDEVFCWGQGVQGNARDMPTTTAQRILSASDYALGAPMQLASGDSHVCVVLGASTVCWGANDDWQISSGLDNGFTIPVLLPLHDVRGVALGVNDSLALSNDGNVLCWGNNDTHQCGPEPAEPCAFDKGSCVGEPRAIATLSRVGKLAAGGGHACAVDDQGSVQCWGTNYNSEAGIIHPACRNADSCLVGVTHVSGTVQGADQLALGSRHSCALVHRQVFCWGLHYLLGQNVSDSLSAPLPAPVLLENDATALSDIVEIAAGDGLTCALDEGDNVYCWGIVAGQALYGARRIPW